MIKLLLLASAVFSSSSFASTRMSYAELKKYYEEVSHGTIIENPHPGPLLDQYLHPVSNLKKEDLVFKVDERKHVATSLSPVSAHSINELFLVDPLKYIQWHGGRDFVDAKKKRFQAAVFNEKAFAYEKEFIHLSDWKSLDHPPVMDLGPDLAIWSQSFAEISVNDSSPYFSPDFQKSIDRLSSSELSFGNEVKLLENGDSYAEKLKEVTQAKESVLISVMSFFCDRSSSRLEDLLIQKAAEGVDVKIIVERVWTLIAMKKCYHNLRDHGVDFVLANDLTQKKEDRALFHNKFMIIDGKLAFIGGMNFIKNDNESTGFNRLNKDEDVKITGPLVADILKGFLDLYKKYRDVTLDKYEAKVTELKTLARNSGNRGSEQYAEKLANPDTRLKGVCRFVIQSPATDRTRLSKVFTSYFEQAQSKIYIKNGPYEFNTGIAKLDEKFGDTGSSRIFKAIFDRVDEHGVKLTTLGNGIDAGSAEYTGLLEYRLKEIQSSFKPIEKGLLGLLNGILMKNGVKANRPYLTSINSHANAQSWEHFQYLHSKVFQIDGIVSSVSSFNMENWSSDKSHESGVICMDERLNDSVKRAYLQDLVNSTPTR